MQFPESDGVGGPASPRTMCRAPRILVGVLAVCTATLVLPVPVAAQSASPEVRRAAGLVVTLRGYDAYGNVTTQGSGFYFGAGRIATNYHVVRGAVRVTIVDAAGETVREATSAEALDERLDLAVLAAPGRRGDGLSLHTFLPEIGDRVFAYGSPKGLYGTMTDGIVSAVRDRGGRTVIQISAPLSPGSSGGPVLDERGRVIGVTVSSVRGGQNLNFAVPARELAQLGARGGRRVEFPIDAVPAQVVRASGERGEGSIARGRAAAGGDGAAGGSRGRSDLAERWQFLARNASDADLYYDRETLARRDDRLRVWIYTLYPETQQAGGAMFDASKALFEFRCGIREFRLNQYLLLQGEKVIGSAGSIGDGSWSSAAPDSVAEGLLRSVCSGDPSRSS